MTWVSVSTALKSRACPASNKTIDLVLTNQPSVVLAVQSLPGMSDHNIVLSSFKLLVTRNKLPQRNIFKYDKADRDKIVLKLKSIPFDLPYDKHIMKGYETNE